MFSMEVVLQQKLQHATHNAAKDSIEETGKIVATNVCNLKYDGNLAIKSDAPRVAYFNVSPQSHIQ